jgi:hypothetical protein
MWRSRLLLSHHRRCKVFPNLTEYQHSVKATFTQRMRPCPNFMEWRACFKGHWKNAVYVDLPLFDIANTDILAPVAIA